METKKTSNRIFALDIAKAICIMLVVVHHYRPDGMPLWYDIFDNVLKPTRMPVFMFASGFLFQLTRKKQSYLTSFISRFKRLFIPYLVASFIIISLKLLFQFFGSDNIDNMVDYTSYFKVFYQPEAGYFLWFIWSILLMFAIVLPFKKISYLIVLFVFSIAILFLPLHFTHMFALHETKNYFVYFMLGIVICEAKRKLETDNCKYRDSWMSFKTHISNRFVVSISFFVFVCFSYLQLKYEYNFIVVRALMLPFFGIFSMSLLSWYIADNLPQVKCKLLIVAEGTFTMYLFHTTFEGFAKVFVNKIHPFIEGSNDIYFILSAVFVISVGILVPLIIHFKLISNYKITRFLFGLK